MNFSAKIFRPTMAKGPGVSATFRIIAVHKYNTRYYIEKGNRMQEKK
jgi:hypothetical protein